MNGMSDLPTGGQGLWITLALVALIVGRYLMRELRVRRMALNRIFIMPAVVAAIALYLIYLAFTTDSSQGLALAVGSLAGIVVGTIVGLAVDRFTSVQPSPTPGVALVKGSYATCAIWLAAIALRLVPRFVLGSELHTMGAILMLNADLLVMLTVAILTVRVRIYMRARTFGSQPVRQLT